MSAWCDMQARLVSPCLSAQGSLARMTQTLGGFACRSCPSVLITVPTGDLAGMRLDVSY